MSTQPSQKETIETEAERIARDRIEKIEAIAAEVIAGTRKELDLEYTLFQGDKKREKKIGMKVRVPNMDDDLYIERVKADYCGGYPFSSLSAEGQNYISARAFLETCGVGPFEAWVPVGKEAVSINGRTEELKPDFSDFFAGRKSYLYYLYQTYVEVANRFL